MVSKPTEQKKKRKFRWQPWSWEAGKEKIIYVCNNPGNRPVHALRGIYG